MDHLGNINVLNYKDLAQGENIFNLLSWIVQKMVLFGEVLFNRLRFCSLFFAKRYRQEKSSALGQVQFILLYSHPSLARLPQAVHPNGRPINHCGL